MPPSGAPFRVPKPKPPLRSPQKRPRIQRLMARLLSADVLAPAGVGLASLLLWEGLVRWLDVPPYLLPGPLLVLQTLGTEGGELFGSLLITLQITVVAFGAAVVSGEGDRPAQAALGSMRGDRLKRDRSDSQVASPRLPKGIA